MSLLLAFLLCQGTGLKDALQAAAEKAAQGDFGAAAAVLRAAGAERSPDATVLAALGTYLLRDTERRAAAGELAGLEAVDGFVAAADVLARACKLDGAPAEAFENWSEALLNARDSGGALRAVEAGLARFRAHRRLLLQKGRVLGARAAEAAGGVERQVELYHAADACYQQAMQLDPQDAAGCVRHGEVQMLLHRLGQGEACREEARKAWREALRRDPGAVDLPAMGQWLGNDAAADLLAEANADAPDATRLWYQAWFEFHAEPRRWEASKEHFERALQMNPGFTTTWYFLGAGALDESARLRASGDAAGAGAAARFAARAWAEYLRAHGAAQVQGLASSADGGAGFLEQMRWLEGVAAGDGAWESAAALASWRTQARPQDSEAWNNLGFFLRESRRYEESLAAYRRGLELEPDNPQLMNDLAVILHYYLKRGDEEAADLYRRAMARAEEILASPGERSADELDLVRTALRDARNNLRKLEAGDRRY